MKPLSYTLLAISILMALYCTLISPAAFNFWYTALMCGIATLGGVLHGSARKRHQNGK